MMLAMRPLLAPSLEDLTVEGILHALSDPVRVAIFAAVVQASCAQTCTGLAAVAGRPVPKSSLSQHLKVLRDAGLIRAERRGVEMLNTSRCAEIEQRFPGLLPAILAAHRRQQEDQARQAAAARPRRATPRRRPTASR